MGNEQSQEILNLVCMKRIEKLCKSRLNCNRYATAQTIRFPAACSKQFYATASAINQPL